MIFPQTCGICGKLSKTSLCNKCKRKLENSAEFQVVDMTSEYKNFKNLIYIFNYENRIRNLIIDYKFNEKAYLYITFVDFILQNEKICKMLKKYDLIIPVPISKKRMKERGYNQSLLIARGLCNNLNIKLETRCLFKVVNIIEQSKLNKDQREENIKNAYKLKNDYLITGKKILLIDDIYTTGSTVNECSKTLQKGNPKEIDILVLAKD